MTTPQIIALVGMFLLFLGLLWDIHLLTNLQKNIHSYMNDEDKRIAELYRLIEQHIKDHQNRK